MVEFKKFSSIEQFRSMIKQVNDHCSYNATPLPKLKFNGTIKLHGCVSSDTYVTLADGSSEKIKDISVGTSILSYNESLGEIEFDIVNDVVIQDLDKDWIELFFDDGSSLKCTVDHPILTKTGWVDAGNLSDEEVITVIT